MFIVFDPIAIVVANLSSTAFMNFESNDACDSGRRLKGVWSDRTKPTVLKGSS